MKCLLLFIVLGVTGCCAQSKVCMRNLGCFEITEDFINPKYRPFNVLPQSNRLINTQFQLYTRKNPDQEHHLIAGKAKTFTESPLNVNVPTKFIVHGFLDTKYFAGWLEHLKDEFLKNGEYNVIIVDWSGGNQLPYSQAAANTRVVGAEIAFLMNELNKHMGISPESCHIVGHSLGAHIAGYAGERIHKVGRITALDPAEPFFQNMPPSVRIDPTDAHFVDVIHTDSDSIFLLGLGMNQLVGHVDFFPNNGKDQPGCQTHHRLLTFITGGFVEGMRRVISCSHQRAVDFFTASINTNNCMHIGYGCSNWTNFVDGKCFDCGTDGSNCAIMGLQADKHKPSLSHHMKPFYLKTEGTEPFCAFYYRVSIKLGKQNDPEIQGKFKLTVNYNSGEQGVVTLKDKYESLKPEEELGFLMSTPHEIEKSSTIGFYWISSAFTLFTPHSMQVERVTITPMNYMDRKVQEAHTSVYYATDGGLFKEMKTYKLNIKE